MNTSVLYQSNDVGLLEILLGSKCAVDLMLRLGCATCVGFFELNILNTV